MGPGRWWKYRSRARRGAFAPPSALRIRSRVGGGGAIRWSEPGGWVGGSGRLRGEPFDAAAENAPAELDASLCLEELDGEADVDVAEDGRVREALLPASSDYFIRLAAGAFSIAKGLLRGRISRINRLLGY